MCCICLLKVAHDYGRERYDRVMLLVCSNQLCDVVVHPACYGISVEELDILKRQQKLKWYCDKCCQVQQERVKCTMCPNVIGAFIRDQNSPGEWIHVVCYWQLLASCTRESSKILSCYLCESLTDSIFGTVLKCEKCPRYFHATCAHKLGCFDSRNLQTLCTEHSQKKDNLWSKWAELCPLQPKKDVEFLTLFPRCESPNIQKLVEFHNYFQPTQHPHLVRQHPRFEGDLYGPLWTRGIGKLKEGLCRLCPPESWFKIKISAYWYHLNFHHGISQTTGKQFLPPEKERYNAEKRLREGLCHQCLQWVPLDSVRHTPVNVPRIYWWKHAQKCH